MEVVEIFSHAENTTALEVDVAVEGAGDAGFGEGVEEDLAGYALQVGVGFGLRHSGGLYLSFCHHERLREIPNCRYGDAAERHSHGTLDPERWSWRHSENASRQ